MSRDEQSVLVSIVAPIINALEFYGLDYLSVLEEAGIDVDHGYAPSDRISVIKWKKLWDLSVHYSRDPCFGLVYSTYIQPSALHGLGLSWIASHTLKEGMQRVIRFQRILDTTLTLELRETPSGYCLYNAVGQCDDELGFPDAAYDAQIAVVYNISKIMLGPDVKPIRVSFEHARPDCVDRFNKLFDIPVDFGGTETAIEFDKSTSELPGSSANPELTRINDQVVIDYLMQFYQDDIVTDTRKYIIDYLPSGVPNQLKIAKALNMSLRNFQRKLAHSGTSYSEVLNQIRYELACNYLQDSRHKIISIAYLLGFSDSSNFSRAFRRWNGMTPNQYREHQL